MLSDFPAFKKAAQPFPQAVGAVCLLLFGGMVPVAGIDIKTGDFVQRLFAIR